MAFKILGSFIQQDGYSPVRLLAKSHLSIAAQQPQFIYEVAMKEYAQKTFHGSFKIDRLVLLKRNGYTKYQRINAFILPPPYPY